MYRPHIRGRNRLLTQPMKVKLCELVAESCTIEQAAETLDVSVRTVQRERKDDEDFDHQLRLSLQAAPDPKKLMESAARTHWRAAAWLLERSDPERYGRRPISSASPQQVEAALKFVIEAALKAAAPDRQNETYDQVRAACDHAFKCLFPNLGPWGSAKNPRLPPTPLADQQEFRQVDDYARAHIVPDLDEAGNALPIILPQPPAPPTAEELARSQAHAELRARLKEKLRQEREAEAVEGILSPKIDFATEFPYVRLSSLTEPAPDDAVPTPSAGQCPSEESHHSPGPVRQESLTYAAAAPGQPAGLSEEEPMASWQEQHRLSQIRQALRRTRNATLARKERAAAKRLKAAKRHARRRAG